MASNYPTLTVSVQVEVWPDDVADVQKWIETGKHHGNSARYMNDAEYWMCNQKRDPDVKPSMVLKNRSGHILVQS